MTRRMLTFVWGFDWTGIVLSSIEVIVVVGGLGADPRLMDSDSRLESRRGRFEEFAF